MKKLFITLCVCLFALTSVAQTYFREIPFEESIQTAKEENKLIFIDFYTDWCGPCKMMARKIFPQKELGEYMNTKFVCIKLNAEKEGQELAQFFNVNAFPTFIVLDTEKKILLRKVGGAEANELMAELERAINPEMTPERMKERYLNGERTTELVKGYATYQMSKSRGSNDSFQQEAEKIVREYFNELNDTQRIAPENLFVYTDFAQRITDPQSKYLITHYNKFPSDIKVQLKEVIDRLFKEQTYTYLFGERTVEADDYALLRKYVNEMGVNDDKWYNPMFELIDCLQQKDYNIFLSLCEKLYPNLDESQRITLIGGLSQMIKTDDKQIKKRASQFIRSRLPQMTLGELMNVVYPLSVFEKDL